MKVSPKECHVNMSDQHLALQNMRTEALTKTDLSRIMPLTTIAWSVRSSVSDAQVVVFPGDPGTGLWHFPDQQEKTCPIPISQACQ